MHKQKILVLDFGSQYAHLIAKRFRALNFYSEIVSPSAPLEFFEDVAGIVFSGGPASIYEKNPPKFNEKILSLSVPILGLCYGHYVLQSGYGGKIRKAVGGEFGFAKLKIDSKNCPLFEGIESEQQVWMSHQDEVFELGAGFERVGFTKDCEFAATQNLVLKRFSLQFHCEVRDTPCGQKIFENFARFCKISPNWNSDAVLSQIKSSIISSANKNGKKKVLLFLSGGVDSTVTFALLNKVLGTEQVLGLHIDNGFMRKNESQKILESYKKFGFSNFISEDASQKFLDAIKNLTDPQEKRAAVGKTFLSVRDDFSKKQNFLEGEWLLAQGTLYPDVIESGGSANAKIIKTHHNRVDAIQKMLEKGLVIEPLKDLYKDEVRALGKKLGLSDELVMRHPFPGPGLSINVLCSTGEFSAQDSKEFSAANDELLKIDFRNFSQDFSNFSVLPVRSVGVQGDFRTYGFPAVLEIRSEIYSGIYSHENLKKSNQKINEINGKNFSDGFFPLPMDWEKWEKIEKVSSAITNSCPKINRVVLKLFQNPALQKSNFSLQKSFCEKSRLDRLREVDEVVLKILRQENLYNSIFQHLTISLPFSSAQNHDSFVLRPVCSEDVMTARFARFPKNVLQKIIQQISVFDFVDAIFYDVTNKPPATFGWE